MNKQISTISTRIEILKGELQGQFGNVIKTINESSCEINIDNKNKKVVISNDSFVFVNPLVHKKWLDGKLEL